MSVEGADDRAGYGPPEEPYASRSDRRVPCSIRLPFHAPYDWGAMLHFLKARAISGVELVRNGCYFRTVDLDGHQGAVVVGPGRGTFLQATAWTSGTTISSISDRLRRLLDLEAAPRTIQNHLAEDATLAPLVARRPGLRVPGSWDGFELATRAILGQQVSLRAAVTLLGRLVENFGTPLKGSTHADPRLNLLFPSPEQLASADLSMLGIPRQRARALVSLARAVVDDRRFLRPGESLEANVSRLRALPGIGEWTAQYVALRHMREPDAFPAQDLVLRRGLERLEGHRLTSRQLLQRAEGWRPWRAYAAQHIWTAEDNPPG